MRLIDADMLVTKIWEQHKKTEESYDLCVDELKDIFCSIVTLIDEQPTVYDMNKVVEKLEEEREISCADFDRYVEDYSPCLDAEYDDFFHKGLERAARIVKRGGADER